MWENPDQSNSEYGHFSRSAEKKVNLIISEFLDLMKKIILAFAFTLSIPVSVCP